jgi:nicotinamide mononucleotide adenylyltransferase
MRESGSVHGRFQPFHNDHLEYLLAAKKECGFLWIGITKFDTAPTEATPLAAIRERPENNPFTFFERINIIMESLVDAGVGKGDFGFVPFPIETVNKLPEFMPLEIPCFTTICEPWNKEKIRVLTTLGYEVKVLWERDTKTITGAAIREDIIDGGTKWEGMVPVATRKWVGRLNIRERLVKLRRSSGVIENQSPERAER